MVRANFLLKKRFQNYKLKIPQKSNLIECRKKNAREKIFMFG